MRKLYLFLVLCLLLDIGSIAIKAQTNLLSGWDVTSGTPYDAGWRVDPSVTVTWGTLNAASGNKYRTNVGNPVNNGTNPLLYLTLADTKFGYPITPVANKLYQLSGKAWRRNGGTGTMTFNFYFANNLLATNPVSKTSFTVSGNNIVGTFSGLRLAAPEGFTSGYFLMDAHVNSGTWNDAGLWLLQLTELGNALVVTFNMDGGSTVASQYFLEGETYTVSKPADPTKSGYLFKGWHSDAGLTTEYNFTSSISTNTTIYAKWDNIKAGLQNLIATATGLLSGGTTAGTAYLSAQINAAQAVVDNPSATVDDVTNAFNALTASISAYQDASLSGLQVNSSTIAGFLTTTYAYNYNLAGGASLPTVTATATASSAATVAVAQVSAVPGSATAVVTAGNGSTKTYTVNFSYNYISGWDGNGMGTTTDIPSDFGWACTTTPSITWINASNSNDNYAYRYRDNLGNGVGRVLTHPLDNNVFSFPLTHLQAGKAYSFTCRNSNINGTCTTMFGINSSNDGSGTMLNSKSLTSSQWTTLTTVSFNFAVVEAGTYYMVWQTTNGVDRNIATDFQIAELGNAATVTFNTDGGSVVTNQYFLNGTNYRIVEPTEPTKDGYTFAGWFTSNTYTELFNFLAPVSANTTVYARFVPQANPTLVDVAIENDTVSLSSASYVNITVSGNSELYILSDLVPLVNSTINLTSDNSWLYFTAIKPSKVNSDWLSFVKIKGQNFNPNADRIAIYGSGTVIIPNGKTNAQMALTVFDGANFTGNSTSYGINTYYKDLGGFNNKIQSFKLKKGFSATLANNSDGTGFSRVFIASDADIEVPAMPEGMEGFVSFIRVFKWEWTAKKGWAGGPSSQVNVNISYDWDAAGNTENMDAEYVPMRHNLGWQSFDVINARNNVSHLLGYNEPDRSDQSNMPVSSAIDQWPEFFKSGLRLGSPAPSSTNGWLSNFMNVCDSLDYRVDFMVTHAYQYQATSWWDWNIDLTAKGNRAPELIDQKRPVWITEWNNGANWTTETWATASGEKRDADLNIIYDANGNSTIVNRPLSPENAAQSKTKIDQLLPFFDASSLLEHHFLYNLVQDARSMELGGKLTPAGKSFAAFKSQIGFKKANEYIHKWRIAPPWIKSKLSGDYKGFILKWYDHNGETGKYYVVERKIDGDASFSVLDTIKAVDDYTYGGEVSYLDSIKGKSCQYRVKAESYKNTESLYSRVITLALDPQISTPGGLKGNAVSSTIIDLSWTSVSGARSYILKRSSTLDGKYITIASFLTDTLFRDDTLAVNTTYYYKVSAINNRGETVDSNPVTVTTKSIITSSPIAGLFTSAGDKQAALSWDFQYDLLYRVFRSDSKGGTYKKVADSINDTRYADKGLENGRAYYYKVSTFNTSGENLADTILEIIPVENQYAYFNFDESEGTTAHDLWGAYHGTLYNNVTRVTGKKNTGLSFTVGESSFVQLRKGLTSELNDFSISIWVNYTEKGSRVFDFGNSTSVFMVLTPGLRYKITCPAGTYDKTATGTTLPTGQWVHLALTQAGTTFKMYMNGTEIFSDNNANVKPSDMGITESNYLVKSQWPNDKYSTCSLDEFRIYNRALSANEINALINGSVYSVKLNVATLTLNTGATYRLTKIVFPDNAEVANLNWSSDNSAIASVSDGLVTANSEGSATISLNNSGGAIATCSVTVAKATSIATVNHNSEVNVFIKDHILYVQSPYRETVEVYNLMGQLLVKKYKQIGTDDITLSENRKVILVRGSTGWRVKLIY